MELGGIDYIAVFCFTLALALVLTPLALRYAVQRQILDLPGEIKLQESPVPYLGGAAIVTAFCIAVLIAALVRPPVSGTSELLATMGLGLVLCLLGLVDDLRGLSPWLRLGVEVGAGIAVWATNAGADLTGHGWSDAAITVAWVVAVTNAFNLLDNMDGLSAGVAAICSFFVFALAAHNGQFLVATLSIAVCGCALGFLRSNFHPARIYMGDAGALFLGFMLAVLTLKLRFVDAPRGLAALTPVLLVGVPLFDTTLVVVERLRHGRSPLSGGRDHTSHRLVLIGMPVPAAVVLIYLGAVSMGVLGTVVSRVDSVTGFVLAAWIGGVAVLIGVLLALVPVYEESIRRQWMLRAVSDHEGPDHGEADVG
jgi:UDP-GlcNAc:undecaprenyl-phosphate GlcNAc-1-phosphate transferase